MADIITLTEKAKAHLIKQMAIHRKSHIFLQAKGGGCAGFKYDWSFPDEVDLDSKDTYIDLDENYQLVIDRYSAFKLIGMSVDYVETISGSSLEITNPNSTSSCGCGESFS
jgi:iron-sulfur cluster insertion protein